MPKAGRSVTAQHDHISQDGDSLPLSAAERTGDSKLSLHDVHIRGLNRFRCRT